jgi:hypothetical protein
MNTTTITDDYVRDLVREADLDWHQGFDLDGDNRYAKLIWNTIALEEKRHAAKVAELEAAERQRNAFAQQANEYAEEARALRARIARLDAQAAQPAQAPLSEQDAGLLNQAHELLECYSAEMRLRGNDSAANGAECSADAILRLFKLAEPAQVPLTDAQIEARIAELEARIDALMLEHCPGEMTPEQVAEWAKHQVPAEEAAQPAQVASLADIDVPNTFKLAGESDEQWIDRITGGKPAQVAAPEQADGWQLVPVEATPEMMKAAVVSLNGNAVYKSVAIEALRIEEAMYGEVYEAMLAAAPKREGGA